MVAASKARAGSVAGEGESIGPGVPKSSVPGGGAQLPPISGTHEVSEGVDLPTEPFLFEPPPSDGPGGKPARCATHSNTRRTACASRSLRWLRDEPNPVACKNAYEPLESLTQHTSGGAPLVLSICLNMNFATLTRSRTSAGKGSDTISTLERQCYSQQSQTRTFR